MAPASASPQPPFSRPDGAAHAEQPEECQRGEPGRHERADEDERYGPLDIERLLKEDGRALIFYARRERQDE